MTNFNLKKVTVFSALLLFAASLMVFQSCKKSRSDLGATLYKKTKNKVFKDATPEGLAEVFKTVLAEERKNMTNPNLITAYYEKNDYDPAFVMDHIFNGDVDLTANYFEKVGEHGLDPKMFNAGKIKALVDK